MEFNLPKLLGRLVSFFITTICFQIWTILILVPFPYGKYNTWIMPVIIIGSGISMQFIYLRTKWKPKLQAGFYDIKLALLIGASISIILSFHFVFKMLGIAV